MYYYIECSAINASSLPFLGLVLPLRAALGGGLMVAVWPFTADWGTSSAGFMAEVEAACQQRNVDVPISLVSRRESNTEPCTTSVYTYLSNHYRKKDLTSGCWSSMVLMHRLECLALCIVVL